MKFKLLLLYLIVFLSACSTNKNAESSNTVDENCTRTKSVATISTSDMDDGTSARIAMVGGYTEQRDLTEDEKILFEQTYKDELQLSPVSVAIQIVAGINYRFICKTEENRNYEVIIYKPLRGNATVSSVSKIK